MKITVLSMINFGLVGFLIRRNGRVDDIHLTKELLKPNIQFTKTSSTISDPINTINNPKRIPTSVVEYTLKANNIGYGEASSNSLVIEDSISTKLKMCVKDKGECKKPYLASNTTHTLDIATIKYKINGAWQTDPTADAEGYNALIHRFKIEFRVGVK